ncbi:N-acetylmuramoyl-L-alanine amidase [Nocardioides sp. CF8]|uniref:N-acetylmuramoyl-L-alanine amidase n=1 Tax=Nocardioides sp. CF8 TaxID=110319 RepID=UPI0006876941|nr:N-acetylmuramoyl-L-alanine amidase [Nocardioides sp. CF8]
MTEKPTGRRALLKIAAGSAGLTAVAAVTRRSLAPAGDDGSAGALMLSTHAGSDVQSLHLPLDERHLLPLGPQRWETQRLPTSTHSMVAFLWDAGQTAPRLHIRSRTAAGWGSWLSVTTLHDVADAGSVEKSGLAGTDVTWIGRADGVQIRVQGRRPAGLTLVLLYPERRPGDTSVGSSGTGLLEPRARQSAALGAARPRLIGRRAWGADESLRDTDPAYIHTIKQVHVHHTVNSNSYAREDVPALLRGMYAYHTKSLGWSDIGYNFLVDRFGRCWVGRAGGAGRLVRGSHTLGFNAESTGISAIGNYDTQRPSSAMLGAIAAIAAWKVAPFERDPVGSIRVESEGSDKFARGQDVALPVIDGHRDTNDTACPGRYLYEALPEVRRRTQELVAAGTPAPIIVVEEAASVTGEPRVGNTLSASPGRFTPSDVSVTYQWLRAGQPIVGASVQSYPVTPQDVGAVLSCLVTLNRAGLSPVVQTPSATGPTIAAPTLRVIASNNQKGIAKIRVKLAGPPGAPVVPTGVVAVTLGKRTTKFALLDGVVVAKFGGRRRLRAGTYAVGVVYAGDDIFTEATRNTTLRIA